MCTSWLCGYITDCDGHVTPYFWSCSARFFLAPENRLFSCFASLLYRTAQSIRSWANPSKTSSVDQPQAPTHSKTLHVFAWMSWSRQRSKTRPWRLTQRPNANDIGYNVADWVISDVSGHVSIWISSGGRSNKGRRSRWQVHTSVSSSTAEKQQGETRLGCWHSSWRIVRGKSKHIGLWQDSDQNHIIAFFSPYLIPSLFFHFTVDSFSFTDKRCAIQ